MSLRIAGVWSRLDRPRHLSPSPNKRRLSKLTVLINSPSPYGIYMTLGNLLTVNQIIPEMKATERWSAIVELIDLLVGLGKINQGDRDTVLSALRAREETMSTGIGFGIAIPHASSDRVNEVVAAFGRSSAGIEFDSLDNAPVKFIVLFVVPKDQFQTHLRTLAAIAKFLNDRGVRDRLATATTAQEILAIFESSAGGKA